MNDDFNKRLKQFTDMLGSENMPENLSTLLSLLANSIGKEQTPPKASETEPLSEEKVVSEEKTTKEEKIEKDEFKDNIEMMRKIKTIMDGFQNTNDPRVNLLTAIRPFLNNTRQKKIGNCIKLFQMSHIARLMSENEKSI
ncbi:MAG: hypothetical protein ACOYWZ_03230 [Bacillota bacterium]